MSLSRTERFNLKSKICDAITDDISCSTPRLNMLLAEFGLQAVDWGENSLESVLGPVKDQDLLELGQTVLGQDADELREAMSEAEFGNWNPQQVRLFISHSAHHKGFVADVASRLAVIGVHGFVAHEDMRASIPWQNQIEEALRTMDAFVLLTHPEVNDSAWCHQEVGWAYGRSVPRYAIRMGGDPQAFIASPQWNSHAQSSAREVAEDIGNWLSGIEELGETMAEGLFSALEQATDYLSAGATAERIAMLSRLSDEQWERLDRVYWSNDQVYRCGLVYRALRPFYGEHDRDFPPPKPAQQQD
ncbi:toll/interleukin-1 receptor domain-containing protein [Rothia sp. AR01]|uniref:Toll/interleukin-1 receptor domain-containing protein n=1 Tax=Rothia santali TaxID=2949643 RepID=A0A9X2HFK0_9MICC|nr:toll/interleukin-1 receptor domain-containing protein [Rothia santali]MCP3425837.1 toll/interleukin-1 receptor domain-containing protein [Rothia santali]